MIPGLVIVAATLESESDPALPVVVSCRRRTVRYLEAGRQVAEYYFY